MSNLTLKLDEKELEMLSFLLNESKGTCFSRGVTALESEKMKTLREKVKKLRK